MHRVLIITIIFLVTSCGTTKQNNTAKSSENKLILPPNTASNKYSEMRQK
ncbi:hypothetical protein RXV94_00070 [Yeosuana sp. MJ-SS3]|uniref:Lipoprotein n=1 Tax=Gilvirhabdus luticola TaxID=3079858 RepID=A0ABU3U291_9FLAO|nr:hypothetical protein [Yeosuana sp. MJ-SS3]MDU8884533.1 hypothetical protein [Yeosuana sp. MJ-SS3]